MIIPGLVSISFRQKSPLEICRLCEKAQLKAVEWGGDVHVPPRSASTGEIRRMTADHGMTTASYGSYFHVGDPMDDLKACLDTAETLAAPIVRIWCGTKGSRDAEPERAAIVDSLLACADEAARRNLTLALEYHGNTLTDCRESAIRLMKETARSTALTFYWQPRWDWTEEERLASLEDVRPRLSHLHVFTWRHAGRDIIRLPLQDGEATWTRVLSSFEDDWYALMEFVQDDSDEALLRDARTLCTWASR